MPYGSKSPLAMLARLTRSVRERCRRFYTDGRDPVYRKAVWKSIAAHILLLVALPFLLSHLHGCIEPYRIPEGAGEPEITVVQMVRAKPERKRYLLNPDSPISFHIPEPDEDEVLKVVEEMSRDPVRADPARVAGALGAGGGRQGGWPEGMRRGRVRFIRLEYQGPDWNDGMDAASASDINFLEFFRNLTGFETASRPESHPISDLRRYPKGQAPPFVYITGTGGITVSPSDIRILREYLLGGGLLFADGGSPVWHGAFVRLISAVFPDEPLRVISDDDPIFRYPFRFPNGAPPLWHHGGSRALGIRQGHRWAVFYHPGDLKDAWRTGHSGLAPHLAQAGLHLGVNVVYHAFTHYLEENR